MGPWKCKKKCIDNIRTDGIESWVMGEGAGSSWGLCSARGSGRRDPLPGRPRVCLLQAGRAFREDLRSRRDRIGEGVPAGRTARAEGLRIREGRGTGGSGRSSQENGGGPSSGRDRRPLRAGASVTEGRRAISADAAPAAPCRLSGGAPAVVSVRYFWLIPGPPVFLRQKYLLEKWTFRAGFREKHKM